MIRLKVWFLFLINFIQVFSYDNNLIVVYFIKKYVLEVMDIE